jgi:hypothetical protein
MPPDVAVMVTFDVPAGVADMPGEDPQPMIRPEEESRMTMIPKTRKPTNGLHRRSASSDPKGSIRAETIPNVYG